MLHHIYSIKFLTSPQDITITVTVVVEVEFNARHNHFKGSLHSQSLDCSVKTQQRVK